MLTCTGVQPLLKAPRPDAQYGSTAVKLKERRDEQCDYAAVPFIHPSQCPALLLRFRPGPLAPTADPGPIR